MILSYPNELLEELQRRKAKPGFEGDIPENLENILKIAFYASLATEEGSAIKFALGILPRPERRVPGQVFSSDWEPLIFTEKRPLSIAELTKLAPATDGDRILIGVEGGSQGEQIWGLLSVYGDSIPYGKRIYQRIWSQRQALGAKFLRLRVPSPGEIIIDNREKILVEFRHGKVVTAPPNDVLLCEGPISAQLKLLRKGLVTDAQQLYPHCIKRLLQRIQGYRHGGALLIVPNTPTQDLLIKYNSYTSVLREALSQMRPAESGANKANEQSEINANSFLGVGADRLHDAMRVFDYIAGLSCAEGAVALDGNLNLLGFGCRITTAGDPVSVLRATDPKAGKVEEYDPSSRGNRFNSAVCFCNANPGALAFVCSQDGPVSALLCLERGTVFFWDEIETEYLSRLKMD